MTTGVERVQSGPRYESGATKAAPELIRGLNVTMSAAIIVGSMVGTGIFLKPSEIAKTAGSAELAILAWIVGGVVNLLGALCYLELGTMMPHAGADYHYLKRAWGPAVGFLYGWKGFALSHPASMAAVASGIALFAGYFWPGLSQPLVQIGPFTILTGQILAAAVIAVLTAVNLFRVATVGWVQTGLSALKVISLIAVIVGGLYAASRATAPTPVGAVPAATASGFVAAVTASLWAFSGWHTLLRLGGEVKDPARTMPRATFLAFGLISVLFILVNVACFAVLGFDRVAAGQQPVADMLLVGFGGGVATLLSVAMVVIAIGSLNVSVMAAARVPYALARDGLLPRTLAHVDPDHHVPSYSVIAMSLIAVILVLTGSFEDLTSLFVFTQWGFYLISIAGLMRLRVREPEAPRPVKAWGYPVIPLLFLAVATVLTVSQFFDRPVRSTFGLLVILLGLPVYSWYDQRRMRG